MNKKLLIVPAIALIAAIGYTSVAKAEEVTGPWHSQMVEQLAAKLGVSTDSVDSAMSEIREQNRAEHQLQMQQSFEERLQTLVDEGKLTQGQREAWIAKHEEWTAEREAERATHREEMQAWFEQEGIDPTILGPRGLGKGMGEGRGMGFHRFE